MLCVGVGLSQAAPARAQSSQSAAAQVLFDEARALMKAGQFQAACSKFEESQRLDPGSGTLINLADCYESSGKLASAWSTFVDAAAAARAAGNTAREKVARDRAAALEPRLPRIVIAVPSAPPAGLEIRRDDQLVGAAQWGVSIPLDPGEHTIRASAPGRKPWSTQLVLSEGSAPLTLTVPDLPAEPASVSVAPPEPRVLPSGLGTQRTLALVAGGLGVVGVAIGSVYGLKSSSRGSDAERYCDERRACWDSKGYDAAEEAVTAGNVSTVAFVIGGAGLAAAGVLWFTATPGSSAPSNTAFGLGPGTLKLRGTW
jgi:hypothetical protein